MLSTRSPTFVDLATTIVIVATCHIGALLDLLSSNRPCRRAPVKIRSSHWLALVAAGVVAAQCFAPGAMAERLGSDSVTADMDQTPAACRSGCTIEQQSVVTFEVDITTISGRIVRDRRGRYAAVSADSSELLIFDAHGSLLDSPRPNVGLIAGFFVDPLGAVQAYDMRSGSLLTFDADYQVTTKTELPQPPALPLGGGRWLVVRQISTPALVGHPLHVMSKDGVIVRSFGAGEGPFRSADIFKNSRAVCLNSDGTIWSIAPGGRLLERWDTSTGRRVAHVTVQSTWFRESSRPAPEHQVASPFILTIWAEKDLVWILSKAPDPQWIPRRISEEEELAATPRERADMEARRFDWVLEAVRSDTGSVVAMRRFDRELVRRGGSFAIASAASANRAEGVELWTPIVVGK
jgi:hypothetical protein